MTFFKQQDFPVVYSYRNALDVAISKAKHDENTDLSAHCSSEKCVSKHQSTKVNLHIPTLISLLRKDRNAVVATQAILKKFHLNHIVIQYEDLVYKPETQRLRTLKDILYMINPKSKHKITASDLDTKLESTSTYDQADQVNNYAAVRMLLNGTEFEYLMHYEEACDECISGLKVLLVIAYAYA
jgi:hypothetical protein